MDTTIKMVDSQIKTNRSEIEKANNIGELKGILSESMKRGLDVVIVEIPRKLLTIDSHYQTPVRTERDCSYLLKDFKREKMLPLTGIPHFEEGLVYLVDGYMRLIVTGIIDPIKYDKLLVMVILNAPTEPKERLKYEAEMYAFQNKNVSFVTPEQRHGAYECLEYPAAFAINELRKEYGFEIKQGKGQKHIGVLGSYPKLFEICDRYGIEAGHYILDICRRSGFDRKLGGYSKYIFKGLHDIWKLFPEQREETGQFLSDYFRNKEPKKIRAKAMDKYDLLGEMSAVSMFMEDIVVANLDLSHLRKAIGKSLINVKKLA